MSGFYPELPGDGGGIDPGSVNLGDLANVDTSGATEDDRLGFIGGVWVPVKRDGGYRGAFPTPGDLITGLPTGVPGDWVEVDSTGTVWTWSDALPGWQDSDIETMGLQPGDPVSALVNDAGYLQPGDPVSALVNDAGYLTEAATDDTLKGDGTPGDPLGVQQLFALRDSADQSIWRPGQTTEGLINQGTPLEDYFGAPLQFTAQRDKYHGFATSLTWSLDSTTQDIIIQLEISGDQGFSRVFTLPAEPTDAGGGGGLSLNTISGGVIGGSVGAGTTQVYVVDVTRWFLLTAGETYTITLRWGRTGGATIEAALYNAQLAVVERFGAPIS